MTAKTATLNEEKELIQQFLENYVMPYDIQPSIMQTYEYQRVEQAINLIIRPECNQQCEYCYIYKYGKELYPTRLNKEETLVNAELFIKWVLEQKKWLPKAWEIFAGDLFYDDFFFDLLDLFEKYYDPIKKKHPELFEEGYYPDYQPETIIIVPSNLSFVYTNPEKVIKLKKYYKRLWDKYRINICFSWSSDGLLAVASREKKDLDQEYFDTILRFCMDFKVGAHPMISPENVKSWVANYDWWLDMINKLNVATDCDVDFQPFMLEVRNYNWTDENIKDYGKFLEKLMQVRFKKCGNDPKTLTINLIDPHNKENYLFLGNYDPLRFLYVEPIQDPADRLGCGMGTGIHLNCTNLSLVICHRTTYEHLTACYFIPNEEKTEIIDIKPQNPSVFIAARTLKQYAMPVCGDCFLRDICMKGCLGAQFEYSGDMFLPIPTVCKFFYYKYKKLFELYERYGIWDELEKKVDYIDEGLYRAFIPMLFSIKKYFDKEKGVKE